MGQEKNKIFELLRGIRREGPRGCKSVKLLLKEITGKTEWDYEQCHTFFINLIKEYVKNDDDAELILSVFGYLPTYAGIKTANKRRNKFLEENLNSEKDDSSIRKHEDKILIQIAERLAGEIHSKRILKYLEEWGLYSIEDDTSPNRQNGNDINSITREDTPYKVKNVKRKIVKMVLQSLVFLGLFLFSFKLIINVNVITRPTIIISPNQIKALESELDIEFSNVQFSSSNTDVAQVTQEGFVSAGKKIRERDYSTLTADISIKDKNGNLIKTILVSIELPIDNDDPITNEEVSMDDYTVDTRVKVLSSGKTYADYVDAKIGDKVQFQVEYRNTSSYSQENVGINAILPKSLKYVEGTTKVYNDNYQNGVLLDGNTIAANGISIGKYAPGANAFIRFTAEVVDNDLTCGSNTLVTWVQSWVGDSAVQDSASVEVIKE